MEKGHLSIEKVVKNLQKLKFWARVPIAVSSSPAAAHMYRWTLRNYKYPIIAICTVCLNLIFTGKWQNLRI